MSIPFAAFSSFYSNNINKEKNFYFLMQICEQRSELSHHHRSLLITISLDTNSFFVKNIDKNANLNLYIPRSNKRSLSVMFIKLNNRYGLMRRSM